MASPRCFKVYCLLKPSWALWGNPELQEDLQVLVKAGGPKIDLLPLVRRIEHYEDQPSLSLVS